MSDFAVDFDGTLCEEEWPNIGPPKYGVIEYVINMRKQGHFFVLWTCREGELLRQAVEWCRAHGLEFDAVNANLPHRLEKYGADCRKIGVDFYIDDRNLNLRL